MRARSRSYGDSSQRTRSPGRMRMRKRRILPATWPRTTWSLSSLTRNIAFGRASITSPSSSTFSSLGTREPYQRSVYSRGSAGRRARAAAFARAGRRVAVAASGGRLLLRRVRVGVRVRVRAIAGSRGRARSRGRLVRRLAGRVAQAVVVCAGVGAEERLTLERLLRRRPVLAVVALRDRHELVPDRRGDRAAEDGAAERRRLVREADPDGRRQSRSDPDE